MLKDCMHTWGTGVAEALNNDKINLGDLPLVRLLVCSRQMLYAPLAVFYFSTKNREWPVDCILLKKVIQILYHFLTFIGACKYRRFDYFGNHLEVWEILWSECSNWPWLILHIGGQYFRKDSQSSHDLPNYLRWMLYCAVRYIPFLSGAGTHFTTLLLTGF